MTIPRDDAYLRMTSEEWQRDVARRRACRHSWKVTARFGKGLENVTCRKCGHRKVRGY